MFTPYIDPKNTKNNRMEEDTIILNEVRIQRTLSNSNKRYKTSRFFFKQLKLSVKKKTTSTLF